MHFLFQDNRFKESLAFLTFAWGLVFCSISAFAQIDAAEALRMEALRQTQSIQQGGKDWPTTETDFFIIHHQPAMEPGSAATEALDSFVSQTLGLWNSPQSFIQNLQQNKLSYYLCDDQMVTQLTGYQTKGMADLAGRAVISSHFPTFHELAHLLVHLTNENPPAQTHPLVQEGIACLLGGRWGRAPETVLYTGWVHRKFGKKPGENPRRSLPGVCPVPAPKTKEGTKPPLQ